MRTRRLTLNRELLTPLQSDELTVIAGGYSRQDTSCNLTRALCEQTSLANSYCPDTTCGFACTANCPTDNCS